MQARPLLDELPALTKSSFSAVSLFSGGGLLDLGAMHAGLDILWANDFEKGPCIAYRSNLGNHIVQGDITDPGTQKLIPDADIVLGGPPCQDFSVAGAGAGETGERGKLVWAYLDVIEQRQPRAFLFENVKGLTTKKHRPTLDKLIEKFGEIGYDVTWKVVNAWDYGVAQKRERVFIVGIRKDYGFTYAFPESEFEQTGYRPVLRDAIGDLPDPDLCDKQPDNHAGHLFDNVGNNPTWDHANRVAPWDKPAPTRTEKDRCDGIHPHRPRRFTVRECLRIQSVPDSYIFPDSMSLSAMYRVVGNGVPSRLAYHLVKALIEQLESNESILD